MLGFGHEEREGALLRRLKEAGAGARAGRIGFTTGENGARRRALVVVARVAQGPDLAGEMRALATAGADAIEIVPRPGAGWIAAALGAVEVPYGLLIAGQSAADEVDISDTSGLDWIHLGASASAHHLAGKGVTRLIDVAPDMPPGRLGGLAGIKADAIVVDAPTPSGHLTVDTLMALATIQAVTKRPVLAASGLGLAPGDAEVLHDHGVEGVLLTGGSDAVREFVAAIEAISNQ